MKELDEINTSVTSRTPTELLRITLYSYCKFKDDINKGILTASIDFNKDSNRFDQSLIQPAKNTINDHT